MGPHPALNSALPALFSSPARTACAPAVLASTSPHARAMATSDARRDGESSSRSGCACFSSSEMLSTTSRRRRARSPLHTSKFSSLPRARQIVPTMIIDRSNAMHSDGMKV